MTPLRRRMLEDMQIRNLAPSTQETYVRQVARFAQYSGACPSKLGLREIRAYQLYLIEERKAASGVLIHMAPGTPILHSARDRRPPGAVRGSWRTCVPTELQIQIRRLKTPARGAPLSCTASPSAVTRSSRLPTLNAPQRSFAAGSTVTSKSRSSFANVSVSGVLGRWSRSVWRSIDSWFHHFDDGFPETRCIDKDLYGGVVALPLDSGDDLADTGGDHGEVRSGGETFEEANNKVIRGPTSILGSVFGLGSTDG